MKLPTELYELQRQRWPQTGAQVMAHFNDESLVVYQAYRPSIGRYAIEHGRLGGPDFSFERMSWVKPNFLWMMYRSGWGTKPGQEITLGLRIRRAFFDQVLRDAVASTFEASGLPDRDTWSAAVAASEVRLQWDPDHDPEGKRVARRAIQLGLRGATLRALAEDALIEVIDLSGFVAQQRLQLALDPTALLTPEEHVYPAETALSPRQLHSPQLQPVS